MRTIPKLERWWGKSSNWKELTGSKGASQASEEKEGLGKPSCCGGGGGWLEEAGDGGGTGSLPYQAPECSLKSHPMNSDQRHEKMQH